MKCKNCNKRLTKKEQNFNWHFGKIWFCCTSCAVAWSVQKHLDMGGK